MDFASGYGRLTRLLVQEIDPSKSWVTEIQEDAVRFQEREFSVNGIVSTTEPDDFPSSRQFDCILVVSLFSHLPEKRFYQWMRRLYGLLSPNGILIFTVHDRSNAPHLDYSKSRIHYNPSVSEIETLHDQEYGSTHVTEPFVADVISRATKGKARYFRFPKGIWHHDIYVVTGSQELSPPDIGVVGPLFPITLHDGNLSGWFHDTRVGEKVSKVEILRRGEVVDAISAGRTPREMFRGGEAPDSVDGRGVASGANAFYGDERFMPNGWSAPLYFFRWNMVPSSYEDDLIVRACGTSGMTRDFPVWIHGY